MALTVIRVNNCLWMPSVVEPVIMMENSSMYKWSTLFLWWKHCMQYLHRCLQYSYIHAFHICRAWYTGTPEHIFFILLIHFNYRNANIHKYYFIPCLLQKCIYWFNYCDDVIHLSFQYIHRATKYLYMFNTLTDEEKKNGDERWNALMFIQIITFSVWQGAYRYILGKICFLLHAENESYVKNTNFCPYIDSTDLKMVVWST